MTARTGPIYGTTTQFLTGPTVSAKLIGSERMRHGQEDVHVCCRRQLMV